MRDDKRYQQIVFTKEDYEDYVDKLFEAVASQLKLLLTAGYVAVVRYDEPGCGIIEIQFEHDEWLDAWGGYMPIWINEDEECYLANRNDVSCGGSLDD